MPAVVGVYLIIAGLALPIYGLLFLALRLSENKSVRDSAVEAGFLTTGIALPVFVITFLVAYLQGVVLSANL